MHAIGNSEGRKDRFQSSHAECGEVLSLTATAQTGPRRSAAGRFAVRWVPAHGHEQDVAALSVRGEIDLITAPVLREAMRPVLERGTRGVVLDLSEVAFMDSTAVHALVDMFQRLSAQNRRLAIVCREHGQVHRLLALVGLLDAVAVHRSLHSAVFDGKDRVSLETPGLPIASLA